MIKAGQEKWVNLIGVFLMIYTFYAFYKGLFVAPTDVNMGEVYRIIYVHVPVAAASFLAGFILFILAIFTLVNKSELNLNRQVACVEVGLLFTILTLATGSIWGKPTWNTWWTWDARLTTTLILGILYAGYRLLYNALEAGSKRTVICSILGIIIAIDIPIIYKSVTWWRTLHQPPSLMRTGGSTLSPEIRASLTTAILAITLLSAWMIYKRARNLRKSQDIESQSYEQLSKGS